MITNIEAQDVKTLLLRVYRRYQTGTITEAQAYKEIYMLNSVLRAIEITNIEDKLKSIEYILSGNNE